jgi:N-acetylglutamate synthase-like GNAT family acetyltransferase
MNIDKSVQIIPFSPELKEDIKTLNFEWLNKYFRVEPKDERILSNPQGEIIDKGGMIFYAQHNDKIVGTASLIKIDEFTFELSKMAVTDGVQGLGIGNKLMEYCLTVAKETGIKKVILYSNRKLLPAIYLYKKYGFQEVELEGGTYERADIKMERII